MLPLLFVFLAICSVSFAAYGGTSTVPYSFEVLPNGDTVMGFARPSCFGWEPASGNPASNDALFNQVGGRPDGFIRNGPLQREPFVQQSPPTAVCFGASTCLADQWVGGFSRAADGTMAMICCAHGLLATSTSQGTAPLHPGEIFSGGERPGNMFDYISNVRPITGENGLSYDVEVRQFACPEPVPLALTVPPPVPVEVQGVVQPAPFVLPAPQAAPGGFGGMYCFAADSTVLTRNGPKRMDQLEIGDQVQVPSDGFKQIYYLPVSGWLHKLPEEEAAFVVVKTESEKEIKMTDNHLIYRSSCNSTETSLVPAEVLEIGDCLLERDSTGASMRQMKISEISRTIQKGIYAPLVDLGKLIVDGIAASCYAESPDTNLVQTFKHHVVSCDDGSFQCAVENLRAEFLLDLKDLTVPS